MVANIAELLEINIDAQRDISACHRLPAIRDGIPPIIIAKFVRRYDRDSLFQTRRNLKNFDTSHLGYTQSINKIYINESLTRKARDIFKEAKKLQKDLRFKYVWTRYGKTYMRKDNDSDSVSFMNMADLQNFKEQASGQSDRVYNS